MDEVRNRLPIIFSVNQKGGEIEVPEEKKFTEKDLHELLRPLREALSPSEEYDEDDGYSFTNRTMVEDRD